MAFSSKSQLLHLMLALLVTLAASARILDEAAAASTVTGLGAGAVGSVTAQGGLITAPGGGAAGSIAAPGAAPGGLITAPGGGAAGSIAAPGAGGPGAATSPGVGAATGTTGAGAAADGPNPDLTFFMHDILGGSNPSAKAITGIVTNPAVGGQVPFAKPNGAVLPTNNGVPQNNGNNGLINNNNCLLYTSDAADE